MDYAATLDWLYAQLPMFSRIGAAALKPDLTNTLALCAALENPEKTFRSIHIAGTNGKGSTSHMLGAIFSEAGYKTGLYTSPHLVDFRERIRIDGTPVSKGFVTDFVAKHQRTIEEIQPSFFEITVAMAFQAFAEAQVDIAVIETGLGGRLDSTNVITPELSIITNISLDHTDLLGKDIPSIAREKAGIIKKGVPVVIGEFHPESLPVFEAVALEKGALLYKAWEYGQIIYRERTDAGKQKLTFRRAAGPEDIMLQLDLGGAFQEKNVRTVLTAISVLEGKDWNVSIETAAKALPFIRERTGLRGRSEVLQKDPLIIADVAHNPAGIEMVLHEWNPLSAMRKHVLLGFVRDKDVRTALSAFPKDCSYHFCAANTPRALPSEALKELATEAGLKGQAYDSVTEAIQSIRRQLRSGDALLITGSFFIVGEAMQALGALPEPE